LPVTGGKTSPLETSEGHSFAPDGHVSHSPPTISPPVDNLDPPVSRSTLSVSNTALTVVESVITQTAGISTQTISHSPSVPCKGKTPPPKPPRRPPRKEEGQGHSNIKPNLPPRPATAGKLSTQPDAGSNSSVIHPKAGEYKNKNFGRDFSFI